MVSGVTIRGDIGQQPAAQAMPELGEAAPLGVIETQATPCQLRLQHSLLFPHVGFQKEGTLDFQNLSPLTCPLA
jgi:hypothetical protein